MSREYAENRIKDALKKTGGNTTRARQQVIAWTYEDSKLLQALTKPHLSGIVAYNIERILSGRGAAAPTEQPADIPAPASSGKEENFGMEILKAVANNSGGGSTFGLESYSGASSRKSKVSQSHIDAIRAMSKGRKSKS